LYYDARIHKHQVQNATHDKLIDT